MPVESPLPDFLAAVARSDSTTRLGFMDMASCKGGRSCAQLQDWHDGTRLFPLDISFLAGSNEGMASARCGVICRCRSGTGTCPRTGKVGSAIKASL